MELRLQIFFERARRWGLIQSQLDLGRGLVESAWKDMVLRLLPNVIVTQIELISTRGTIFVSGLRAPPNEQVLVIRAAHYTLSIQVKKMILSMLE